MGDQQIPPSAGQEIADTFRAMGRIDSLAEAMMDDPEFAARLYQLGQTIGQEIRVQFEGQHSMAWLSKKVRDTVYARTAAIVRQGLDESLGLPGNRYDET